VFPATETAIIAALEREVWPLVKTWEQHEREHAGRRHRFFVSRNVVVVCGGIGPVAARRAAEAAVALFRPLALQSVGFAGALVPGLAVGAVVVPARVIDAGDGSRTETAEGEGILLTCSEMASIAEKARLFRAYGAHAVDMEAAAVAKAAAARSVRFRALKAISDESDFALPDMGSFVAADGSFQAVRFSLFVALRPWWWWRVYRLAANSRKAAGALCERLREMHGL
jgi:adenosylhomocysteine nucleosidase